MLVNNHQYGQYSKFSCQTFVHINNDIILQMDAEQKQSIVIDNGTLNCRAGLSGDDRPSVQFPNVVGINQNQMLGSAKSYYVGHEALMKRGFLKMRYPVEYGVVTNWEHMTQVWEHCYQNQLKINSSEFPCLLTEIARNPKPYREKTCSIMFEQFRVPQFYLASCQVLALLASGRQTGLLIDLGYDLTRIVQIYERYVLPSAIECLHIGGRDLTQNLIRMLHTKGYSLHSTSQRQMIERVKQSYCYVTMDWELEMENYQNYAPGQAEENIKLENQTVIRIGTQKFRCPQILFRPALAGKSLAGLSDCTYQSIQKCDIDLRRTMYENIVLAGGGSSISGLAPRLLKQLKQLAPVGTKINVTVIPQGNYSTWVGGSLLAGMQSFGSNWISKNEYQEVGSSIVHRKCF